MNISDNLSVKILTRIGTDGSGNYCGGHSDAVGLRLYFDSLFRPAKFGVAATAAAWSAPMSFSKSDRIQIVAYAPCLQPIRVPTCEPVDARTTDKAPELLNGQRRTNDIPRLLLTAWGEIFFELDRLGCRDYEDALYSFG